MVFSQRSAFVPFSLNGGRDGLRQRRQPLALSEGHLFQVSTSYSRPGFGARPKGGGTSNRSWP